MILAGLGFCGGQLYRADLADHGRRDWLVLAAAPGRVAFAQGFTAKGMPAGDRPIP